MNCTVKRHDIPLQRAINARNLSEAKMHVAAGADVNQKLNPHLDTMLHKAIDAGIARDLLECSANVNAKNLFKQTPLHSAVIAGKIEVVKVLLENRAEVDIRDFKGFTPLSYAVKRKNVEAIKYLVMYNANINFKPNACRHCYVPPILPIAMLQDDLASIKALIKYAILRRNCLAMTMDIDLRPYYGMENFHLARTYKYDCEDEMHRMKNENLCNNVVLFQMIVSYSYAPFLYFDPESMELNTRRIFEVITGNNYPQYHDVIIENLRDKLKVFNLKSMLCFIQISSVGSDSDEKEPTTLNQDITSVLAKYLSKNDMFNLILASSERNTYKINPIKSNLNRPLVVTSGSLKRSLKMIQYRNRFGLKSRKRKTCCKSI